MGYLRTAVSRLITKEQRLMFSKIKNWFVGVEHDIEAIIENFTSTVTKLEAAAEADAFASNALAVEANQAEQKARSVAEKIKALVA